MGLEYSVVHLDQMGYRVAGSLELFDDKGVAYSILQVARSAVGLAKSMNKPIGSITINWKGGVAVVKVKNGEVIGIILEEAHEEPPSTASRAKALA